MPIVYPKSEICQVFIKKSEKRSGKSGIYIFKKGLDNFNRYVYNAKHSVGARSSVGRAADS